MADLPAGVQRFVARVPLLEAWVLATLDVVALVLIGLLGLHASGRLGALLAGLNTLVGVALFLALWGLFTLALGWVLIDTGLAGRSTRRLLSRGVIAGAVTGAAVVLVPALGGSVARLLTGDVGGAGSLALIGLVAAAVASVVGALVGLLGGLLDLGLNWLAGRAVPDDVDQSGADRPATPDRP